MSTFIDTHRERFGVEPICRELEIAPSTYYAHKSRPASLRALRDEQLKEQIRLVFDANYGVYGADKIWAALNREGTAVARCTVERLMRRAGLAGVIRGRRWRTTIPDDAADRPEDRVQRDFSATAPNQLWVADFTYVATWSGVVYVAFVIDVFSRRIVGWQLAGHMRTDLVLDALRMALHRREPGADVELIHHSDRGSQYTSIDYTQTLTDHRLLASVGSVGDAYDNALAESFVDSFKTELIRDRVWRTRSQLELAVVEYVGWYNAARLHENLGDIPPIEYEQLHALREPTTLVGATA
jgi:putative transposase